MRYTFVDDDILLLTNLCYRLHSLVHLHQTEDEKNTILLLRPLSVSELGVDMYLI